MVRGLYSAYTGMNIEQRRLDIISNNLANAATVGYKQEGVTNQSFDNLYTVKIKDSSELGVQRRIGTMNLGVKNGEVYTDFGQGSIRETGNTFDLAIEGKGFFAINVKDKNGNESVKYTRDGSFKMGADGQITDTEGNPLIGSGGNVQIPVGAQSIVIDVDGTIYVDGEYLDKIELKDFEDYKYLEKYGTNYYTAVDGATEKEATGAIQQGYTEQSNINTVSEMVQMIAITRAYEANYKVMQTVDSSLQKSCNDLAKI